MAHAKKSDKGPGTTRRDFLKASTVATSAAALGTLGIRSSLFAAGSGRVKIALIGCGARGTGAVADCLRVGKNIQLVAVADVLENKARASLQALEKMDFGGQINVPEEHIFVGFDAYKKAIATDIDLALLCAPPGFRPVHYHLAIQAGKHAFLEKPVCVDAPGFRLVMQTNKLADEKSLRVCVGHMFRYSPQSVETVKRIRQGGIGRLKYLQVYMLWRNMPICRREPGETEMRYQMRNWRHFVWLSGDLIVEGGLVHDIDIANWIIGGYPVEAHGIGGRQRAVGPEFGQLFDHSFIEYTYADGTKLFAQERHMPGCWSRQGTVAHGTEGIGGQNIPSGFLSCWGRLKTPFTGIMGKQKWTYQGPRHSGYRVEHMRLIDAILNDKELNDGYWGAQSSMTVVLGRMASYSGQIVKWDEAVEKGPAEFPYDETLTMSSDPPVLPDEKGNYPVAMPGVYKPY